MPQPQPSIIAMDDDDTKGAHMSAADDVQGKTVLDTALSIGAQLLPRNILDTYVHSNLLGIIVFFTLIGKSTCKQKGCEKVFGAQTLTSESNLLTLQR